MILVGENNVINGGSCSFIGNGKYNKINSSYSSILGGCSNTTDYNNTFILGSNITAEADGTTYVNRLNVSNIPTSSSGLPRGSVWSDGGVLKIV